MKRRVAMSVIAAVGIAALSSGVSSSSAAAEVRGERLAPASVLDGVTGDQVIIVTTQHPSDTHGTLRALQRKPDGSWVTAVPSVHAWVGRGGVIPADERRQGSGTTPSGTFRLLWAFGVKPDPQTQMRYLRVNDSDVWPYDPRDPQTYNVFQPHVTPANRTWRQGWAEPLAQYTRSYRHAVVLDYNLPNGPIIQGADGIRRTATPARRHAGGGIFLHSTDGTPTSGCVAVRDRIMVELLQWLDPAEKPVIIIRTLNPS